MSSSLVSGPYASAVSIKFTPSSTVRLRTFRAFSRSGGQPQMPSPVTRIAPKPRRLTVKSPPKLNVGFVAMFDDVAVLAPKITSDLPARIAAPLARLIPTNLRRVTPRSWFRAASSSVMTRGDTFMTTVFKCKAMIPFAHASQHRMRLQDFFQKSQCRLRVRHDENLSASHIAHREQTHDSVRHFRRAVRNGLRSCWNAIETRPPQNRVVTMNDRTDRWIGFINRSVRQRFG